MPAIPSTRRLPLVVLIVGSIVGLRGTGGPALAAGQERPTAEALARSLQQRYQGIRDFSADFVHSYRGGALRTQISERGTAAIKKPGMMRWEYTSPEKKTFVSDGRKMYSYIPQDRQVVVSTVPPDDQAPAPVLFLAGKGNITRDFTPSHAESRTPGTYALKLVPRTATADYDALVVILDATTLQIRGLTTFDRQGGESSFLFSNLKENRGLADRDFVFRIPRGVDLVTDGETPR